MQGKASDGESFDILATDVTLGDVTSADLFLNTAQYNDGNKGETDQKLTMTPTQAVFSGAKLTSLTGSNITVTGMMVC